MELLKSASKIVFVLMALGAILGFFFGKLSEANFMMLALASFSFYFTKTDPKGGTTQQ